MINFWYEDAVVYELDVKTFQDSNGDGIGDFTGLTRRIPYIAGLGATCLWLRPFHPSPLKDDGYDITDYYAIDSRLGSFGDFIMFLREARDAGLRVVADLVVNHTSDEHPWFQTARSSPDSPFRDWYVWSKHKRKDPLPPVFPGPQKETWTYDSRAKAYFHHRFMKFQPDLNTANPEVREEIGKIMAFWLELGISGFRLDAAPFLLEHQPSEPNLIIPFSKAEKAKIGHPFQLLREMRQELSWCRGDAVFMAEANVDPDQVKDFFGPGDDRMHLLFNFLANQHLMLALARKKASALVECLHEPTPPRGGRWLTFLRNHDELDIARLSEEERQEIFAAFAPEENMRAYGRGVRRRLAPMLGGDRRRISLAHSLLLSFPGTPVIRYGEEIGMGDDLSLPERLSVRTPMQWSSGHNAGFSTAAPDRLIRPVISSGDFGYERVSVARQSQESDSLMNRLERLIRARKNNPDFSRGKPRAIESGDEAVFIHRCDWRGGTVLAFHNLADRPARVKPPREVHGERLTDLIEGRHNYEKVDSKPIELPPYGYRWFRVSDGGPADRRLDSSPSPPLA